MFRMFMCVQIKHFAYFYIRLQISDTLTRLNLVNAHLKQNGKIATHKVGICIQFDCALVAGH